MTVASGSSGTPSALEKSPLDFANENPPPLITERDGAKDQVQDGLSQEIVPKENPTTTEVVLEPNMDKEIATMGPISTHGGKSLASMGLEAGSTFTPATQDTPAGARSMSDLDPLSYAKPQPIPEQDIAQSFKKAKVTEDPDSEKSTSFTSMSGSQGSIS
ncbi:hypothetical protein Tco_0146645 [Tanacetum coccineum]